jgi:hypothetical protein
MAPESELTIPGSPVLCDYEGRQIRNPTIGTAVHRDGTRQDFAIALDPSSSTRGYQRFAVDLSDGDGPILTLNAYFTEGSDGGTDRWQLGTPLVFEPLPDEPEELPAEIVIDQLASRVGPDGRDAIRVTAEFDRPVRLNASLLGGLDLGATSLSDPCLTGPAPSHASAGLSRTHSFRLDGLCLRSRYSVLLEVEAADGTTASFADMTIPPFVPDGRYFSGIGWTDGYHVEYTVRATIPGIGETIHVVTFGAAIDGVDFDFRGTRRCAAENRPPEGQVRRATDVWGDEVTVTVVFFADDADNAISSECVPYESLYGRDRWSASVTTTFTIEDFMAGEVSIPFRAAPVGSGRSLDENAIVISGVVTG